MDARRYAAHPSPIIGPDEGLYPILPESHFLLDPYVVKSVSPAAREQ